MTNDEIRRWAKDIKENPLEMLKLDLNKVSREDFRAILWIIATAWYHITDEELDEARELNRAVRENQV